MRKFISGVLVGAASTAFGIWFLGREQLSEGERMRNLNKNGFVVVMPTFESATQLMLEIERQIRDYGCISVAQVNELIDRKSDFQDTKAGWYDTDGTSSVRGYSGYVVTLPAPIALSV